jgi:hypothetical protein
VTAPDQRLIQRTVNALDSARRILQSSIDPKRPAYKVTEKIAKALCRIGAAAELASDLRTPGESGPHTFAMGGPLRRNACEVAIADARHAAICCLQDSRRPLADRVDEAVTFLREARGLLWGLGRASEVAS